MTDERKKELRDNYLRVAEKIEAAKQRRGGAGEVTLLAASKTMPAEDLLYLCQECGVMLFGENRAQEFTAKYDAVYSSGARMDFIGHLQTNKVKYVVGRAGMIHTLDSEKLAAEINRQAESLSIVQDVLIEVNVGGEESKTGISAPEAEYLADVLGTYKSLNLRGMMAMTPVCEKNSDFLKYFAESYRIFIDIFEKRTHNIGEVLLSMGMSDSYECAIEEGANIVRVGTSLFGTRDSK